jgi:hypothetical protein
MLTVRLGLSLRQPGTVTEAFAEHPEIDFSGTVPHLEWRSFPNLDLGAITLVPIREYDRSGMHCSQTDTYG